MKRILIVIVVALVAGVCAFSWTRSQRVPHHDSSVLLETMPELAWLRDDLKLTDSQFAQVSKLHAAYLPECADMCQRIADAHERLDEAARGQREVTAELKSVVEEYAKIHAECQERMLAHLYETARILDAKQAERYLEVMLPYALDFSHSEPEDVHVR
jgi:flagellar motility protein MotE (MotC chaperone)